MHLHAPVVGDSDDCDYMTPVLVRFTWAVLQEANKYGARSPRYRCTHCGDYFSSKDKRHTILRSLRSKGTRYIQGALDRLQGLDAGCPSWSSRRATVEFSCGQKHPKCVLFPRQLFHQQRTSVRGRSFSSYCCQCQGISPDCVFFEAQLRLVQLIAGAFR